MVDLGVNGRVVLVDMGKLCQGLELGRRGFLELVFFVDNLPGAWPRYWKVKCPVLITEESKQRRVFFCFGCSSFVTLDISFFLFTISSSTLYLPTIFSLYDSSPLHPFLLHPTSRRPRDHPYTC